MDLFKKVVFGCEVGPAELEYLQMVYEVIVDPLFYCKLCYCIQIYRSETYVIVFWGPNNDFVWLYCIPRIISTSVYFKGSKKYTNINKMCFLINLTSDKVTTVAMNIK